MPCTTIKNINLQLLYIHLLRRFVSFILVTTMGHFLYNFYAVFCKTALYHLQLCIERKSMRDNTMQKSIPLLDRNEDIDNECNSIDVTLQKFKCYCYFNSKNYVKPVSIHFINFQ